MKYITTATRNDNIEDAFIELHKVNPDMTFDEAKNAPVTNRVHKYGGKDVRRFLNDKNAVSYTNVTGSTVTMFTNIQDEESVNENVTIIGKRGKYLVVQMDGELYSIYESCIVFGVY